MHLRDETASTSAEGLVALLCELSDEQRKHPQVLARTQEEAVERGAVTEPARSLGQRCGREVRPRGVAGDQVADADPVVREQTFAVRCARDDLGCVLGVARHHQLLAIALEPAERRDPIVVAVEDPELARRCHRGQERLPVRQPVGPISDPARHRVDRARSDATSQDGVGKPIDLHDHEALAVGRLDATLRAHHLDKGPEIRSAAVDPEQRDQRSVDDRVDDRREPGGYHAIDVYARRKLDDEEERHDLEDHDQDPHGDQRPRGDDRE